MARKIYAQNYKTESEVYYDKLSDFVFHSIVFIFALILIGLFYFFSSLGKYEKSIKKYINSQTNEYCNQTFFIPKRKLIKEFGSKDLKEFNKVWKNLENSPKNYEIKICEDGSDDCIRGLNPLVSVQCKKNIYWMNNKRNIYRGIITITLFVVVAIASIVIYTKKASARQIAEEIISSLQKKQKKGIKVVFSNDLRSEFPKVNERTWKKAIQILEKECDQFHVFTQKGGTVYQLI